jgi:ABC-type transport system substrate-binding protein
VIGFTQEPASLWTLVEDAAVARQAADLLSFRSTTTYSYDYQAAALKQVPTIENGGATNVDVDVQEGDIVWSTAGEAITLTNGVEVRNAAGEPVTFDGSPLKMKQLTVNFEYVDGLKWEDGTPVTRADYELGAKVDCDPESGATSFLVCESRENIEFKSDTAYTITYRPGVQWAEYSIYALGAYPAHQVLSDGRKLADVPASEYSTLPEIAEDPLSAGPYKLVSWEKGQRMVFEANENYYKGAPKIKQVIIQFFEDTNQAVAQLLTGDIDILEKATLGAGPEVETVIKAAAEGKIQAHTIASPTWEHMDMNLFTK